MRRGGYYEVAIKSRRREKFAGHQSLASCVVVVMRSHTKGHGVASDDFGWNALGVWILVGRKASLPRSAVEQLVQRRYDSLLYNAHTVTVPP